MIIWGDDVISTILIWDVISEELGLVLIVDVDTVGRDLDGGEGLRGNWVAHSTDSLRRGHGRGGSAGKRANRRGGVGGEGSCQGDWEWERGGADLSDRRVSEEGHAMPVAPSVLITRAHEAGASINWVGNIERGAET